MTCIIRVVLPLCMIMVVAQADVESVAVVEHTPPPERQFNWQQWGALAREGDPEALARLVADIQAMTPQFRRQWKFILRDAERVGDHPQVIDALAGTLLQYNAFFQYSLDDQPGMCLVIMASLQWSVSMSLDAIVDGEGSPDMAEMRGTNAEWTAEQWRAWWFERKRATFEKLQVEQVIEQAKAGDIGAVYYLGEVHEESVRRALRQWLTEEPTDEQRYAIHAALSALGDEASRGWLVQHMRTLPLDQIKQEEQLLIALRHAGGHPDLIEELIAWLDTPIEEDVRARYRVTGWFQASPPRAYMAARTLAVLIDDEQAPKLRDMRLAHERQVVEQWKQWAGNRAR